MGNIYISNIYMRKGYLPMYLSWSTTIGTLEHNSNYIGFKPFRITLQASFTTLITDRIHVIFSQTNVVLHVPANGEATDDIFIHGNFIIITTYYIEHIPQKKKWSSREIKSYTIFFRSAIEIYHWNFDNNTAFFNWKYSPLTIWLNLYIKAVGGREFGCIQLWTTCPCKILF